MNKKIVLVEDEVILQKALSIELLSAGFEVMTANDGEAGEALIKNELPDLVLLDITLPKKLGFDVLKELKHDAHTKHIPVIILSNMAQDTDKELGHTLGATDYYVKSGTNLGELTQKITKLLQ